MPEFSHEDIKNAIEHANDGAPESSSVDAQDQQLPPLEPTAEVPARHRDDMHEQFEGLTRTYDDVTARVPRKHRDSKNRPHGHSRGKKILAGVVGTAVFGGLGVGAVKILNETAGEEIPPRETPTSQTKDINEQDNNAPVTIENINTRPTQEQLRLAEQPVTAQEHPKPKDAYQALIDRRQTYTNGAIMDFEQTPPEETPESVASGERLLTTIYGTDYESRPNFDNTQGEELRWGLGLEFYYLYDSREEVGTFRLNSEVQSVESTYLPGAKKAFTIRSSDIVETNIFELDPSESLLQKPSTVPRERDTVIFLAPDGNWYIYGTIELE